jgi:hypothetical protein
MLLPLQLGIVRVLEHWCACFGCVEPVCAMREWAHHGFTGRRGDQIYPDHVVLGMLLDFLI